MSESPDGLRPVLSLRDATMLVVSSIIGVGIFLGPSRVAEALPHAGVPTPVVFCHSKFGPADDLSLRRPAPALPELGFWHEDDFEGVLLSLFATVAGETGREAVRGALEARLDRLGKETRTWIASN